MTTELKVPYLGTAEEDVLLTNWFVAEGDAFKKGQVLAAVETLKASFDVEAIADGVLLRRVVDAGERVALQAVIGLVGEAGEKVAAAELDRLVGAIRGGAEAGGDAKAEAATATVDGEPACAAPPTCAAPSAAPAARRLAKELGVELARVRGTGPGGLIRLEDVQAAARGPNVAPAAASELGAGLGDRRAAAAGHADGRVDAEFLAYVRGDRAAFGALASDFKVALYRRHGAVLGDGVVLAPGAVLLVDHLALGAGGHFGPDACVEAHELRAGDRLRVGGGCRVHCRRIRLGDDVQFATGVEIGGDGVGETEAELVVGHRSVVGERAFLDPSHRLELGDDVVVARNAVVTTSFVAGNPLLGYPMRRFGVKLGDRAHVGPGATVMPGVEMGAGVILLANSTLVGSPPAGRLFAGVPAVDLQQAAETVAPAAAQRLACELVLAFAQQFAARNAGVDVAESEGSVVLSWTEGRRVHRLRCGAAAFAEDRAIPTEDVRVAARVDDAVFATAAPDVVWFDLSVPRMRGAAGSLATAFRTFLAGRGVRLGGG